MAASGPGLPGRGGVTMSTLHRLPRDAPLEQQLRAYRLDHSLRRMGYRDYPCYDVERREAAKRVADLRVAEQAKRRRLVVQ